MADENKDTDPLDALLTKAAAEQPGADLMARVLGDAEAVQAGLAAAAVPTPQKGLADILRRPPGFVAALGGWGGFGGVTAAGVVGLALGFWSPDLIDTIGAGQLSLLSGSVDWAPDVAGLALENDDV